MAYIRNLWSLPVIIDDVDGETLVLNSKETAEVPAETLSKPMVRHYLQVHRLDLMPRPVGDIEYRAE